MHTEVRTIREELAAYRVQRHEAMESYRTEHQVELTALAEQRWLTERHHAKAQRRFRVMSSLALAVVTGALFLSPANRAALAQGTGLTLQSLQAEIVTLQTKTQFISIDSNKDMHIVGTNLHIENGLGATNGEPKNPTDTTNPVVNARGNLIVGYNYYGEKAGGSHNVILGDKNFWTSFGGLALGAANTISSPYASVSGGDANTASAYCASVSGGGSNAARGTYASVSGGGGNTASASCDSISGGYLNTATNWNTSISGGYGNSASGILSSVGCGQSNTASGYSASISNGYSSTASGQYASILGGKYNTATNYACTITGGHAVSSKNDANNVSSDLNSYGIAPRPATSDVWANYWWNP